jgi:uncharacterized protein YegP (UPF0339 family)
VKKWIRSLALAAAVAAGTASLVTVSGTPVQGQVKDKLKEQPKVKPADPAKPAEVKGAVVITKDKGGKFRFQVRDGEDKVIMQCVKGYDTEKDAVKAFEDALAIAKAFKPALEKDGK